MSAVDFHDPDAPVEHRLVDMVFTSDEPDALVVSLAAAEVGGVSYAEIRLRKCDGEQFHVLSCWEGPTTEVGDVETWGASLSQFPELIADAVRVIEELRA